MARKLKGCSTDTHIKSIRNVAPMEEPMCEGKVENNDEKVEYFAEDETTEVDIVSEIYWNRN